MQNQPPQYFRYQFSSTITEEIKKLQPDNWHWIFYLLKNYLVIAAFIVIPYVVGNWFYLISIVIIGAYQRGIELSEHCSTIEGNTINIRMSRNRRSRGIEKFLTGVNNDHYHLDHHLNPTTPLWLLPKAHRIRLQDDQYREHCKQTAGLFQRGRDGTPSIIGYLLNLNRLRYDASLSKL